jgi:hypothetical protein
MVNTITVTQTFVGLTEEGNKIYNVHASAKGDASSAAIAIPVTKLRKIRGLPGMAITLDDQVAPAYMVSETISGTTITVTVNAVVENNKYVEVAGEVIGI